MELRKNFSLRAHYMKELEVPAMSVIKEQLGEPLAQVMFDSCPEALKPLVGLTPPLQGAGDELWTSPSDLLVGKVCLKPPLTSKHLQALTHQGILGIGIKIEQKLVNQMEIERRKALEEQEAVLRFMFEKEKKDAVERAIEEQQRCCDELIESIKSEFEERLQQQLNAVETEVLSELSTVVDDPNDDDANIPWKEKHNDAVMKAVKLLTKAFLEDLEEQKNALTTHFKGIIKRIKLKYSSILVEKHIRHKDMMRQLKHYLECKNVANMMYILCMERRKCLAERKKVDNVSKKKVKHLEKVITKQKDEMEKLQEKFKERQKKLRIREHYLTEVLKQFQKFINFVLRAAPTQAEFLLNLEKLTRFELIEALNDEVHIEAVETVQPWCAASSSSHSEASGLLIKDHHDCYNEEDVTSEDDSEIERPIVFYNKNMYVREDFRNMLSQGIEIAPDNLLWNKDVARLIKIMKQSVEDDATDSVMAHVIEEEEVEKEIIKFDQTEKKKISRPEIFDDMEIIRQNARRSSIRSASVHFHCNYSCEDEDERCKTKKERRDSSNQASEIKSALSKRFFPVPEFINYDSVGSIENKPNVLGSSDSMDLIMKTRLGRKWRRRTQRDKEEANEETQTSWSMLPIITANEDEQIQVEEVALKVVTANIESAKEHVKAKKKKKKKTCAKATETPQMPRKITAVEKVRAAIEMKKQARITEPILTGTLSSFKLEAKDSLIKHRRSLVPKIEMENGEGLEIKKSRLSMSRDSLDLAKESMETRSIIRKAEESKLSIARDSLEVLRKKRSSITMDRFADITSIKENDHLNAESKLTLARDSLEILRASTEKLVHASKVISKLELARDSLEIIKQSSRLSFSERKISESGNTDEFKDSNIKFEEPLQESIKEPTSVILLGNEDRFKTVKLSHVEILEVDDAHRRSRVFFYPEPEIIDTMLKVDPDEPEKIYKSQEKPKTSYIQRKKGKPDNFLRKRNKAKVAGDKKAQEYLEGEGEFMLHRINSFLGLFKKNPSLVRIFSSVSK